MSDETADPDSGGGAPSNTDSGLEREASRLGERARARQAVPGSQAAKPPSSAQSAEAPVQAGLFDLLGPRESAPVRPHLAGRTQRGASQKRKWQGRSGPLRSAGPARCYLPTRLGGHSEQHLAERRRHRPFDLLRPEPAPLGMDTVASISEKRSGPLDLLGPLNPRQCATRLGGPARRQRNGTDDGLTLISRGEIAQARQVVEPSDSRTSARGWTTVTSWNGSSRAFLRRYLISANLENEGWKTALERPRAVLSLNTAIRRRNRRSSR